MNSKSINIHRLSTSQKAMLYAAIFFLILSVIVFVYAFAFNRCNVENGQFGDLIAGTIGVGASFFTMLLVVITMEEQRKMNRQIELHHLVESFNHTFDRFTDSMRSFSKTESQTDVNHREHLKSLWKDPNGIMEIFGRFATKKITDKTKNDIIRIKEIGNDEDLVMVARTMNRLSDLKREIGNLDPNAAYRINDDWETIPNPLKLYAGFYYAWLPEFKNEIEMNKENEIEMNKENEMIPFFRGTPNNIFPASLPRFSIVMKDETPFSLNECEFADQSVQIESLSYSRLVIFKIIIMGSNLTVSKIESSINIVLEPMEIKTLRFGELFGTSLQPLFYQLTNSSITENPQIFLDQDICINYNRTEWTYQNQIEFYRFEDLTASIILKKTQNNY